LIEESQTDIMATVLGVLLLWAAAALSQSVTKI